MLNNSVFFALLKSNGLPIPTPEYRFHSIRRWRFDFAWIEQKLVLEVEGGVFSKGRHTRPIGFLKDIEKYNEATLLGWRIIRTTPSQLLTNETINLIKRGL